MSTQIGHGALEERSQPARSCMRSRLLISGQLRLAFSER